MLTKTDKSRIWKRVNILIPIDRYHPPRHIWPILTIQSNLYWANMAMLKRLYVHHLFPKWPLLLLVSEKFQVYWYIQYVFTWIYNMQSIDCSVRFLPHTPRNIFFKCAILKQEHLRDAMREKVNVVSTLWSKKQELDI